ncbi:MAG: metal ABC transporter substrate-binding protein, partial [Bdellovibrionaceae bacterium]|nr:metal ABC transporter substrate-binding protein [Pseudobdellovibrionaceae bacterium]
SLIPESATWHEYTLTPRDLNQLSEAYVLFLLGKDIEGFSKQQIQGKIKTLKVIELNEEKLPFKDDKDPHYWNHPLNFIVIANAVARELISVDPNWQKQVNINLTKIESEIVKVHEYYLKLFAGLKDKTIIISHNSISFYGKAYGIKIFSPTGFNSLDQTIPSDLISIKKMLKDNPNIPLFREVNSNNIFLEKLAKDLGLSIKGDINGESLRGKTYEAFLKQNLEVIYSALK